VLTAWEPFIDVMAHTGAGLGTAPAVVNFEEIDKAASERPTAEGVKRARGTRNPARGPRIRRSRQRSLRVRARVVTIAGTILRRPTRYQLKAIVLGTRVLTGLKSLMLVASPTPWGSTTIGPVIVVSSPEVAVNRAANQR
jgi:hypothetical protein